MSPIVQDRILSEPVVTVASNPTGWRIISCGKAWVVVELPRFREGSHFAFEILFTYIEMLVFECTWKCFQLNGTNALTFLAYVQTKLFTYGSDGDFVDVISITVVLSVVWLVEDSYWILKYHDRQPGVSMSALLWRKEMPCISYAITCGFTDRDRVFSVKVWRV